MRKSSAVYTGHPLSYMPYTTRSLQYMVVCSTQHGGKSGEIGGVGSRSTPPGPTAIVVANSVYNHQQRVWVTRTGTCSVVIPSQSTLVLQIRDFYLSVRRHDRLGAC